LSPVPPPIEAVEVISGHVPMHRPLDASHGREERRFVVFVRLLGGAVEGWGECAALSAPTYDETWAEGERQVLVDYLAPALLAEPVPLAPAPVEDRLARAVRGHLPAKAALVSAALDALGRVVDLDAPTLLGATNRLVPTGASIGTGTDLGLLLDEAERLLAAGYRRLKIKIRPGFEVAPLEALIRRFGDEAELWADANGAFDPSQHARLRRLDELGLGLLEQPFPPGRHAATARLAAELRTPVALDEDVRSPDDVALLAALGAADIVVVKPSRLGGPLAARRALELAQALGLGSYIGGMLETSLGRSMSLAVAGLPGLRLPGDLSAPSSYLAEDPATPSLPPPRSGLAEVAAGPGLGVRALPELLRDPDRHLLRRDA